MTDLWIAAVVAAWVSCALGWITDSVGWQVAAVTFSAFAMGLVLA